MLLLLHEPQTAVRTFQGFALIRAVLFYLYAYFTLFEKEQNIV